MARKPLPPVKQPVTPREQLLREAIRITTQDRNAAHGNPEDNFRNIAAFWSTYLTASCGCEIIVSPQDVGHLMMLQKIARLSTNPQHYDSLLDVAGYAACAEDCRRGAQRNESASWADSMPQAM